MSSLRISTLESKVLQLEIDLRAAKERLFEAQCEEAGVAIGDIVSAKVSIRGKFALQDLRVTGVKFVGDTAWVTGNLRKKDGNWSLTNREAYGNWEMRSERSVDGAYQPGEMHGAA